MAGPWDTENTPSKCKHSDCIQYMYTVKVCSAQFVWRLTFTTVNLNRVKGLALTISNKFYSIYKRSTSVGRQFILDRC